jgi:hypothetical protein
MGHIRPVRPGDIPQVVNNLRQADIEEWEAFSGVHPRNLLPFLAYDPNTNALVNSDGVPVGLFGVTPFRDNHKVGIVWMVATPLLIKSQIEFLRKSVKWLDDVQCEKYPVLFNYVDARNTVHIRWLKWCGFQVISRKERWGAQSLPFYEIVRIKSPCA